MHWARIADAEGVEVLGIASEMNALAATLPVEEIPGLAAFYLSDEKQAELRNLLGRYASHFTDDERIAMGAGDFASLEEFLVVRNQAERRWARAFTFAAEGRREDERIALMNRRRARIAAHWRDLIEACRRVFDGYLTLAANFDNYHEVAFWDRLDFIGINAYFPLRATLDDVLSSQRLEEAWREIFADFDAFRETHELRQPALFTELGYTRRSGVTVAPWSSQGFVPIWEKGREQVLFWTAQAIAPKERALAVESLFEVWREDSLPLIGISYWKLSSRLDLGRYEPFMLYLGEEANDPLYPALTRFSSLIQPLEPSPRATDPEDAWYRALLADDEKRVQELARLDFPAERAERLPPLHLAVRLGRKERLAQLLELGRGVEQRDLEGRLALHEVCYQDDPSLVERVFPSGEIDWQDHRGETPLHACARLDRSEVLAELLRLSPQDTTDLRNERGETALHLASDQASPSVVERLLDHAADPEARDAQGLSALHIAARRGDPRSLRLLLDSLESIPEDRSGQSPLAYAAYYGQAAAFDLLWRLPSAPERGLEEQNLLHLAAHGGNVEVITTLLEAGLAIDARDSSQRTPLYHAMQKEHRPASRLLLERGASLELSDHEGITPFHVAAAARDPSLLQHALSQQPSLDRKDASGSTALHHAAGWGRLENVRMLLAAGADPDQRNGKGETALDLAESTSRRSVAKLLRARAASPPS